MKWVSWTKVPKINQSTDRPTDSIHMYIYFISFPDSILKWLFLFTGSYPLYEKQIVSRVLYLTIPILHSIEGERNSLKPYLYMLMPTDVKPYVFWNLRWFFFFYWWWVVVGIPMVWRVVWIVLAGSNKAALLKSKVFG